MMGKAMHKQLAWSSDMDLALLRQVVRVEPYDGEYGTLIARWKVIAVSLATLFEYEIKYRSARDHYESMVEAFKSTN
ncbi:hypothetical protein H310_15146 [Aphanomyces invadans]|uniref:Uncharacterized protein n=1 Tax=Aphanomyces invadans TaxID=157072 RepID=A0A024T7X1_9STRA|nr:hypothetical protein H310_15146 [Aphanomyces invadans]ETV90018.1 hypothetical protein H310_15146 [Aphanomyces invadans]|eukprot:XP_008881348.1 hypothetical protein H310_15146 [Aphanomyces invadans]